MYLNHLLRLLKHGIHFTFCRLWSLIHKELGGRVLEGRSNVYFRILDFSQRAEKMLRIYLTWIVWIVPARTLCRIGIEFRVNVSFVLRLPSALICIRRGYYKRTTADSSFPRKPVLQKLQTSIKCWWPCNEFHFSPGKDNFTLLVCSAELKKAFKVAKCYWPSFIGSNASIFCHNTRNNTSMLGPSEISESLTERSLRKARLHSPKSC